MGKLQFETLLQYFDELDRACDTPEKATDQLKSEGLLDDGGRTAEMYRDSVQA